jgi:nitrite reductase/ring-hydroxylating ferredoxin subunit
MRTETEDNMEKTETSRRSFLNKLWAGLGVLALAECLGLTFAFLRPRKPRTKSGEFGGIIIAGPVDNFSPNSVTAFTRGHFYLSRLEGGGFLAISRKCTHLGCTVPWLVEEKQFRCPCHASAFDIRGEVISPPASRALGLFKVVIENDIVKVDTGKLSKRSEFREWQVVHPGSFRG